MLPRAPIHDNFYGCITDAEFARQAITSSFSGGMPSSNLVHLFRAELALMILFPAYASASRNAVSNIVGLRAEREMVWADARRVVARMPND